MSSLSLLSLALAAESGRPSITSLTVIAKHGDSCPYVASFKGAPPEEEKVHRSINSIWDECNLTDLRRNLKPSLFVASIDGSKFEDCCETTIGLAGISTSHGSHVVDVPFLYCGTYEELAANAGHQGHNGRSIAQGNSSNERVGSGVREISVTAARLLRMGLSHASNVYVPWCHMESCAQPVRKVCAGNSTLACHWAGFAEAADDGYEFQLFDRSKPDETVYAWSFLISSGESQGVTEEMQEAVEDLILLGDDSESEEGSESVDSIRTVSPVPSV
jgi:hypothetical protein